MDGTELRAEDTAVWIARHAWIVGLLVATAAVLTGATLLRADVDDEWALVPILACLGPAIVSALPRRHHLLSASTSAAALMTQAAFAVSIDDGMLHLGVLMLAALCVVALYEIGAVIAVTFALTTAAVVALAAVAPHVLEYESIDPVGDVGSAITGAVAMGIAAIALGILWRSTQDAKHSAEEHGRALEAYLDVASTLMVILDRDGNVVSANRQTCRTLDREEHELVGRNWFQIALPPEQIERSTAAYAAHTQYWDEFGAYEEATPQDYENEIITRDGRRRTIVWWATSLTDARGRTSRCVCSGTDVTEQRTTAESLKRAGLELDSLRRLAQKVASLDDSRQAVVDSTLDLAAATFACIFEPDRTRSRITVTKSTVPELVNYTIELGKEPGYAGTAFLTGQPQFVADLRTAPLVNQGMRKITGSVSGLLQPVMSANGTIGVLAVGWAVPVLSLQERRAELVGLISHEAAIALRRRESLAQLERAALVDPLTGVANRRAFDAEMPLALRRGEELGTRPGLIMLDLNEFKAVNDEEGHEAGDTVLIEAAAAWADALRAGDLLARLGGDEFAVLLPDCDERELVQIVERLRRVTPHRPGSSVGGAIWDGREPASNLIRRADEAQYDDKAAFKKRLDELGIPHGRGRGRTPVEPRPPRADPRAEPHPRTGPGDG